MIYDWLFHPGVTFGLGRAPGIRVYLPGPQDDVHMVQWPAPPDGLPCKSCGGGVHGRRRRSWWLRTIGPRLLAFGCCRGWLKDPMTEIECKSCGALQGRIFAAASVRG